MSWLGDRWQAISGNNSKEEEWTPLWHHKVAVYIRPSHSSFFSIVTDDWKTLAIEKSYILICFNCYVIAQQLSNPTYAIAMSLCQIIILEVDRARYKLVISTYNHSKLNCIVV